MIVAKLSSDDGQDLLLFLLEPGNIAKLEIGQPIVKDLCEFIPQAPKGTQLMIALSPDVVWLANEVQNGADFVTALEASLRRKPNYRTPAESESITRFK